MKIPYPRIKHYTLKQLRAFERELNEIVQHMTEDEVFMLQRKMTLDMFIRLVKRTPVDLGFARGGWEITIGVEASGEKKREDPRGEQTIGEESAKLGALKDYNVVYVSNNVPYILVLDQGLFEPPNPGPSKDPRPHRKGRVWVRNAFSVQAPNGMVDITIEEIIRSFAP